MHLTQGDGAGRARSAHASTGGACRVAVDYYRVLGPQTVCADDARPAGGRRRAQPTARWLTHGGPPLGTRITIRAGLLDGGGP
jgi:hypothetical protein